ncbi:MAG: protein-L-isoaspartate(D-aspartate) O-methyltransferase [Myxococcota bacterium]
MAGDGRERERAAMVERVAELFAETAAQTGLPALDPRVRAALESVPRHRFVPDTWADAAYDDAALAIGRGQTISQPFIVALSVQLAEVGPDATVLEVGAGSGYQAAVLARLARRVYAIEIVPELAARAAATLAALGVQNAQVRAGDGHAGWPAHAPFDAIVVAAAAREPPPPLVAQLAPGGRMVVPVGPPGGRQDLLQLRRDAAGAVATVARLAVSFVPFTRAAPGGGGDASGPGEG